jgi:hypothetical protein
MIDWMEHTSTTGKTIRYRVDIDAREFQGRPGMAWLLMAANINLSINELLEVMAAHGLQRTRSWIARRRWIFFDADYVRASGGVQNADGKEVRAYEIMGQHPRVSARELARILRKQGIKRGKDWVLKHRVSNSAQQ